MNGGTCIDRVHDYYCLCLSGFTGARCDVGEFYNNLTFMLNIYETKITVEL